VGGKKGRVAFELKYNADRQYWGGNVSQGFGNRKFPELLNSLLEWNVRDWKERGNRERQLRELLKGKAAEEMPQKAGKR